MKRLLMAALGMLLLAQMAQAAAVTWVGGAADNLWTTKGNWSTGAVPGANDDVIIGASFTVDTTDFVNIDPIHSLTLDGTLILNTTVLSLTTTSTSTLKNLTMNALLGQSGLTVNGTAEFTGNLILNSGIIQGPGTTTIKNTGAVTVTMNSFLVTATVNNEGSITITQPNVALSLGSITVNNKAGASINLQTDGSSLVGSGAFGNSGIIAKTDGTGTSTFSPGGVFTNNATGNVLAQSGTLLFSTSGSSAGAFNANGGATLQFAPPGNFILNAGTTMGGSGTINLTQGGWDVEGPLTINTGHLIFGGGQLTGNSDLTVNSRIVTWNSGFLSGTLGTKMTLGAAAVMTITTAGSHAISRNLDIFGTVNLNAISPGGDFFLSPSTVTIEEGATFNIQTDNSIHGNGTINNSGTFEKTGGTGISTLDFGGSFNVVTASENTVTASTGTLNFAIIGSGALAGIWTATSPAILKFSAGNYTLTGAVFTGSGTTLLTNATWIIGAGSLSTDVESSVFEFDGVPGSGGIQGSGELEVLSPNFTWTGGPMQGRGKTTISAAVVLTIKNGQDTKPIVSQRKINNFGMVTIADDTDLALGGGAIWNNQKVFTFAADGGISDNGGGATFNNNGIVQKTGGSVSAISFSGTFNNNKRAKVVAAAGELQFVTVDGASEGDFIATHAGSIVSWHTNTWTLFSGSTMTGPGLMSMSGGAVWNLKANVDVESAQLSIEDGSSVTGDSDLTIGSDSVFLAGATTRSGGRTLIPKASTVVNATGPLTVSGSTLDNSAALTVSTGAGSLIITNGGALLNEASGKIIADVTPADPEPAIQVNSGTFTNFGSVTLGLDPGASPTQTIGGLGLFNNQGTVSVPSGDTLVITPAYTQDGGATTVSDGTLNLKADIRSGSFGGTGFIFLGPINIDGGTISAGVGNQPGILNLNADLLMQANGTLSAPIGGTTPGRAADKFSQINSSSSMALNGTLNLAFLNGFSPAHGNTFNILNFASSSGTFSSIKTPSPTCTAQLTTTATSITVAFTSVNVVVQIKPTTATVKVNATKQFAGKVKNGCGNGVKWSVKEGAAGGSVTQTGLYTAPATTGTFHVVVTSVSDPTKKTAATVTVIAASASKLAVTPQAAVVQPGGRVPLHANQAVVWSVAEGIAGGSITTGGTYTAPIKPGVYHVVASGNADASNHAVVNIAVVSGKLKAAYITDLDHNSVSVLTGLSGNDGAIGQLPETESVAAGQHPTALAISPQAKFLLAANQDSNDVSMFTLSSDGTLTPVSGPSFPTGKNPSAAAFDPSGSLLFVINHDSDDISVFSVDKTTGVLAFLNSQALAAGDGPSAIVVHPSGSLLYVVNAGANTVQGFNYDADGKLKPIGSPLDTGVNPSAALIDAAGKFLFVTNRGSGDVSVFVVDAKNETMQEVNGSPYPAGKGTAAMATDVTGTYLFVADHDANDIATFQINGDTGDLTLLGRTPLTATGPSALAVDPSGQYLYVASDSISGVTAFKLDVSTGGLVLSGKIASKGRASSIVVARSAVMPTQAP